MPTTLNAVERASIEFEELGRNLNMLSGPIRRAAVPALAVRTMGSSTGDGMRRIAQDVTALTQVPVFHVLLSCRMACCISLTADVRL